MGRIRHAWRAAVHSVIRQCTAGFRRSPWAPIAAPRTAAIQSDSHFAIHGSGTWAPHFFWRRWSIPHRCGLAEDRFRDMLTVPAEHQTGVCRTDRNSPFQGLLESGSFPTRSSGGLPPLRYSRVATNTRSVRPRSVETISRRNFRFAGSIVHVFIHAVRRATTNRC